MNYFLVQNATFYLYNSSLIVYLQVTQQYQTSQLQSGFVYFQNDHQTQYYNVSFQAQVLQFGNNQIIQSFDVSQLAYYQIFHIFLFDASNNMVQNLYCSKVYYNNTPGQIKVNTFNLVPTDGISLYITIYGLNNYEISKIQIEEYIIFRSQCQFKTYQQTTIYIFCDLAKIQFQQQQYLASIKKQKYINLTIVLNKSQLLYEQKFKQQQVLDLVGNCLSDPNLVFNGNTILIIYQTQMDIKCINLVYRSVIQINITTKFKSIIIEQSFEYFTELIKQGKIIFILKLDREQTKIVQQFGSITQVSVFSKYQFPFEIQQYFNIFEPNQIIIQQTKINTLKFSKNELQLVQSSNIVKSQQYSIQILFYFTKNNSRSIIINQDVAISGFDIIKVTDNTISIIKMKNNYQNDLKLQDIFYIITKTNDMVVFIKGVEYEQLINNIINLQQYFNRNFILFIIAIALIQVVCCLSYFLMKKQTY